MGKIRILSDDGGVYAAGTVIGMMELIRSFCDCCDYENRSVADYVCRIPMPSAVAFIAESWGLQYEFV